ncbi:hypothetical protein J421_3859 [Gemmatirosa kalamazoonensis]|uniref:Lipoprotein n=1 Tax=Gemmatirosa kalamazoonensis TaxID=861299 RepID=W0RKV1_9BACT|nr:hypothetical protein [Gemmatirosa kalamazoonensis]AHG91396.1 hypothetical protein J421_3859 [Gemmatirosa kalamazoonensis]
MSLRRCLTVFGALAAASCSGAPGSGPAPAPAPSVGARGVPGTEDTTGLVPPGFGTLRLDDVSLQFTLPGGVLARAIPLDESVIRLLSPDTYRALHEQVLGRSAQLREIARRYGLERYSVWRVTFYGTEQGEARFSPQEVIVTDAGRDFRPLDLVPLTPGFGEQRLQQRGQQTALYVFDGALDVWQSQLAVTVQGVRNDAWGASGGPLARLDRERTLVRGRAAQSAPSKATSVPRP